MAEMTRLVRPAPQVSVSLSPKDCHAEGITYPNFRLLNKKARILLSPQYLSTDQKYTYRTFVVSNSKGWFAAVQNSSGSFAVVLSPLSDLRKSIKESTENISFTPQRTLSFADSEPNVLALACTDTRLVVGFKSGQIVSYDTSSIFTSGANEISPVHVIESPQHPIVQIAANPNGEDQNLSNLLAVLRADGTVQVLTTSLEPQGGWGAGDTDSTPVAVAWSPKGKQLAIGLRLGDILTFTLTNKSAHQRHIPPTTEGVLASLNWLAPGHTFRTSYTAADPVHHIVFSESRTSPVTWTRLEHSFQVPDRNRQSAYTAVLPKWDNEADDRLLVVVGDVSCTDLEIIGNVGHEWYQQSQENPLSIPLDKESEDTVLLSLEVDLTDTEEGCPIIYAYLNDGTLQGWYVDHPERKPYQGMLGAAGASNTMAASNPPTTSPFSQPQQTSAFGLQPANTSSTSAFGQPSPFGQQTSSPFGQKPASTSAFGQPSLGQTGFGQTSTPSSGFGSSATSNSGGGFAAFASNTTTPFGTGSFGSSAPSNSSPFGGNASAAEPPQITRDDSMSDSSPAFGGLSLGGGSDDGAKAKSAFGGGGGIFGSPTPLPLPPNHPSNQPQPTQTSAFGSGGGSFIKPATGFGAFGGGSGSFGAFGNTNSTTPSTGAFTGGAFSAKPEQSTAFGSNTQESKPAFGQSSFGQPSFGQSSFGKPSFGQPSFGQSGFGTKPATVTETSSGFGAFAQNGPTSFGSAATSVPKSEVGGGGFASFAGNPSAFGSAATSGKSAFGAQESGSAFGDAAKSPPPGGAFASFASKGPSAFGQSTPTNENKPPFGGQSAEKASPAGGAFSGFASSGPSVFGQPAPTSSGSAFGSPAPASGSAFGGAPTQTSAFGSPKPVSTFGASADPVVKKEETEARIKSEPGSPQIPSSPESVAPPSPPPEAAPALPSRTSTSPSPSAFGNLQTSSSAFKPAAGFGAFGSVIPSSSPFFKKNDEKPATSAFGSLGTTPQSAFGAPSAASPSASSTSTPTFGSTSKLGFGFGLNKTAPEPTSTPSMPSSGAGAFSAFSGTTSAFGTIGGSTKSFGDLLKEGGDKDKDKAQESTPKPTLAFGNATAPTAKSPSPSTPPASVPPTSSADQAKPLDDEPKDQAEDQVEAPVDESAREDKGKGKAVEESDEGISHQPSHKSISSQASSSSFVEVEKEDGQEDGGEEDEVPESDEDAEGEPDRHGDDDEDGDFLSESYGSQSEDLSDGNDLDEVEEKEDEGELSRSPSPEPAEIPLPPSRSRSSTPQAEAPVITVSSSPTSSDDSDDSRLSTIREESTTPPGTPTKPHTVNAPLAAPTPINPPSASTGLSRPSTRPTRSSPLASQPLSGADEDESEANTPSIIHKPRPASPRTPFGVLPSQAKSVSPEPKSTADTKRPKTPPLLSNFFGGGSPSTPTPSSASVPALPTPSKTPSGQITPLLSTPVAGLSSFTPPATSSNDIFGKPFSLKPTPSPAGDGSASPKTGGLFSPAPAPSPSLFSTATPKPEAPSPAASPIPPGAPRLAPSLPTPFTPSPNRAGMATGPPSATAPGTPVGNMGPSSGTAPKPSPPPEDGMQKECLILFAAMSKDMDDLRRLAELTAKKREMMSRSAGGSRRKEDLGQSEKWAQSDSAQFGVVLRQFEQDIRELKAGTEKQEEELRELEKSMVKAGTRREEIARFNKAKSDNEFSKMLKSRTLGPEHLENQTQLRRNIRALRTRVEQLEDQLREHKKKLSEVNSGRPTLRPPSLNTINRTYRNIDIAVQQQLDALDHLNARFSKLDLSASVSKSYNVSAGRDPRLPPLAPRSRPSIITPDVAVTTAAALNAERSAQKLKNVLLKARKEPLLNTKGKDAVEGGKKVPTAFSTPKAEKGSHPANSNAGLQFNTPIVGPLFGGASPSTPDPANWDALSFPEDNFHPSTPLSAGGRRGATQKKHSNIQLRKSPGPAGSPSPADASGKPPLPSTPPPPSFDWGPLPTFNKASPGLPGFDKVMNKSNPTSPSPSPSTPSVGLGLGSFTPASGLFGNANSSNSKGKGPAKAPETTTITRRNVSQKHVLSSEILSVTSAMRKNSRWASSTNFMSSSRGSTLGSNLGLRISSPSFNNQASRSGNREADLMSGFQELKRVVRDVDDISTVPLPALLSPFFEIIRSPLSTGPITSAALSALHSFFVCGIISAESSALDLALVELSTTVARCKFEPSDSSGDEVVLLKILTVIHDCLCAYNVGNVLGDVEVCEMLETVLTTCCQMRLSEILRRSAESTMHALVRTVFSRLHSLDPETEEAKLVLDDEEGEIKMSVSSATLPTQASTEDNTDEEAGHEITADAQSETKEPEEVQSPSSGVFVPRPQYSLPSILELLRVLVNVLDPNDQQHTDSTRMVVLGILNSAFEEAGPRIGAFPSLQALILDPGCKYLFQLARSDNITVLHAALRTISTMFDTMREHLKLQQELFLAFTIDRLAPPPPIGNGKATLSKKSGVPASPRPGTPSLAHPELEKDGESGSLTPTRILVAPARGETRNLVLETLNQISRHSSFMVDLYANYDCDINCENLFERLIDFLTKSVYPSHYSGGLDAQQRNAQYLCLDLLLAFVNDMANRAEGSFEQWPSIFPSPATLMQTKSQKKLILTGASRFNTKPKTGLAFLEENGLIYADLSDDVDKPLSLARFLKSSTRLDKRLLGDFISRPENIDVLKAFIGLFDFKDKPIADAMREMLETFRLPGESQQIARITETFASIYFSAKPAGIKSEDAVYVLAYSVIMLNTDLHNPQVRKRMSVEEYKRNLRGVNDGSDFSQEFLQEVYDSIRKREIVMPEEHTGALGFEYAWKELLARSRQAGPLITCNTPLFDVDMFKSVWKPVISAIAYAFISFDDDYIIQRAIAGFRQCATLAGHFNLPDVFDFVVVSLSQATSILPESLPVSVPNYPTVDVEGQSVTVSNLSVKFGTNFKGQLAAVVLFNIVNGNGNALREGWTQIFEMFQNLFLHSLLPTRMLQMEDFLGGVSMIPLRGAQPKRPPARSDGGLLSALSSYLMTPYGASSDSLVPDATESEIENTLCTIDCITSCRLDELYSQIMQLELEALVASVRALEALAHERTVAKLKLESEDGMYPAQDTSSGSMPYDPASVFLLETMVSISCQAPQHIEELWPIVFEHLSALLHHDSASQYSILLIERAVVGLLRLCLILAQKPSLRDQIYVSLDLLSGLPPDIAISVAEQIVVGVMFLVQKHREIIRSQTEWKLVFALIRSTISHPEAARLTFDLLNGLVSDGPEQLVTMDNYSALVTLLNDFAVIAGTTVEGHQHQGRRHEPLTAANSPAVERGRLSVELLSGLKKFFSPIIEASGLKREDAWEQLFLPLLTSLKDQSSNAAREIRQTAIGQLQRTLLASHSILDDADSKQVEQIFNKIVFPLVDDLLKPQVFQRDPRGIPETRLRASALLCKTFMHFEVRESQAQADIRVLWIEILDLLDRLMHVDRGEQLYEAVPESLKNVLLVMNAAQLLVPPSAEDQRDERQRTLWTMTTERMERFLPGFLTEIIPVPEVTEVPPAAEVPA